MEMQQFYSAMLRRSSDESSERLHETQASCSGAENPMRTGHDAYFVDHTNAMRPVLRCPMHGCCRSRWFFGNAELQLVDMPKLHWAADSEIRTIHVRDAVFLACSMIEIFHSKKHSRHT